MRHRHLTALALLMLVHAGLLAWGALVHSPTIDEIGWLPGGLAHWKARRLDIVVNHPPIVGLVAAMPLLLAGAESPDTDSPRNGRSIGREFIRMNGNRSLWYFTIGRWACIPFSIVGAIFCFVWARDLYSPRAGLVAAMLWCFCPNILAHGQLVSQDVPACSFGLIATYAFWRWLRKADWTMYFCYLIGLGLALLTKMTMLVLLAVWPLVWVIWRLSSHYDRQCIRHWLTDGVKLIVMIFVAIDVLNAGYGFKGTFARLDSFRFQSKALGGELSASGNQFSSTLFASVPVPFPRAFVLGVDFQRFALEGGLHSQFSYLRGKWSTHGWPYYYFYALLVKVPLGTWCLLILSIVFRLCQTDGQRRGRDELVVLAPAVTLLVAASVSLRWTDHLRHVLPVLPFAFIWISRVASPPMSSRTWSAGLATSALAWSAASSLWVYPHSLSYFNESVGGPSSGHYHLLSSNIDFGQDLLKLKQWCDNHPEARPLGLAYWDFDSVDPHIVGIDYYTPPTGFKPGESPEDVDLGPKPGWYAVNVNLLHGDDWPGREFYEIPGYYGYLLEFSPIARAGYSILIFHVTTDEANRLRAKFELPAIDTPENICR